MTIFARRSDYYAAVEMSVEGGQEMRKVSVLIAMCFVLAVALTMTGQNQQNALKNIMT